jgi:hypothetical protein
MQFTDPLTVERLTTLRVDTARRQAQTHSLLHPVGLREQQSLPHRARHMLRYVGHQLVVVGGWLEQFSTPRPSH